ncbi:MAG: glycosyltransferase [Acidobacteriota bacterium]|nr:glycosyltransferase [Acidobacteriota bacterium]
MATTQMRKPVLVRNDLSGHSVDLVVGIPSYNEADNIAFVVEQVAKGLTQYYPERNTVIINADNCSEDGTEKVFLSAESFGISKVYLSTPSGIKGKGHNFHNMFTYLRKYKPQAVVVVDADLQSISPEWPQALAEPISEGCDFVTPMYSRNEYDGTITNHICYPLLFGLLGKKVRQPIGGDFAFSGRLMEHWITRKWGENICQYGVDIFMTVEALMGGFRVAQTVLGSKVHKPSAPKLGEMFTQVVDTLFSKLLVCKDEWIKSRADSDTPKIYGNTDQLSEPQDLSIDYKRLKRVAVEEFVPHHNLVEQILPTETARKVQYMFQTHNFRLSSLLWVDIVYSFLKEYSCSSTRTRKLNVVEALKPLYFARVISFIRETLELNHLESEDKILRQASTFRSKRNILIRQLTC